MTATWSRLPYELLDKVSGRIVGEVKHINRIVLRHHLQAPRNGGVGINI